jgi:lysozyme
VNAELRERLMRQLIRYEGKRNRMYLDSKGVPTIGIGHNLRDKSISDRAVAVIFEDDIADVERDVDRELPWVAALSLPRQAVIYDMVFNMGIGSAIQETGLLGFSKMLAAAQSEQWDEAAKEILASDYHKDVGRRAEDLAHQMRSGEWGLAP